MTRRARHKDDELTAAEWTDTKTSCLMSFDAARRTKGRILRLVASV